MKSKLIVVLTLLIALTTIAQEKLTTKSGVVKFEASTPNFEPVAAINTTTSAVLKDDGTIAVLSLVKGFRFKKALMQKHFNSKKWVNSKEFPKTKFSGTIVDYKKGSLSGVPKEYTINGKLTFHGVTKDVTVPAMVSLIDGVVIITTKFTVKVTDYGIIVKSKLAKKIAKSVNVALHLKLK